MGSDVLIAKLSELGFESFVESDNGFSAYINEKDYFESAVDLLFNEFKGSLTITSTSKLIPRQNWNKKWESNFQPIDVDGTCYIRAPFHVKKAGYKYDIVIEPKMSFGTGHHFTTQLMIKKLLKLNLKNKAVLDMGCGTGVLAVLASMKGAEQVTAIDIDDWSYENCIENLKKNKIKNGIVHKGNVQKIEKKIFYTILANINKNVLLEDLFQYEKSLENGGDMLLSGFFETSHCHLM